MLYGCNNIVTLMARIVVEVTEELKQKVRDYKKREGFKTEAEAVRYIIRGFLKGVNNDNSS